jgi:hypothetical protein
MEVGRWGFCNMWTGGHLDMWVSEHVGCLQHWGMWVGKQVGCFQNVGWWVGGLFSKVGQVVGGLFATGGHVGRWAVGQLGK